jgi:hypothetical protein
MSLVCRFSGLMPPGRWSWFRGGERGPRRAGGSTLTRNRWPAPRSEGASGALPPDLRSPGRANTGSGDRGAAWARSGPWRFRRRRRWPEGGAPAAPGGCWPFPPPGAHSSVARSGPFQLLRRISLHISNFCGCILKRPGRRRFRRVWAGSGGIFAAWRPSGRGVPCWSSVRFEFLSFMGASL